VAEQVFTTVIGFDEAISTRIPAASLALETAFANTSGATAAALLFSATQWRDSSSSWQWQPDSCLVASLNARSLVQYLCLRYEKQASPLDELTLDDLAHDKSSSVHIPCLQYQYQDDPARLTLFF
jgi:hypothetical protein